MTTEELQTLLDAMTARSFPVVPINTEIVRDIAAELIAARAKLAAAEGLAEAVGDFAKAKIEALRSPGWCKSPEDEPDPVVEADYVWALQSDAKDALAAWEAAK